MGGEGWSFLRTPSPKVIKGLGTPIPGVHHGDQAGSQSKRGCFSSHTPGNLASLSPPRPGGSQLGTAQTPPTVYYQTPGRTRARWGRRLRQEEGDGGAQLPEGPRPQGRCRGLVPPAVLSWDGQLRLTSRLGFRDAVPRPAGLDTWGWAVGEAVGGKPCSGHPGRRPSGPLGASISRLRSAHLGLLGGA